MTITIDLPSDTAARLAEKARQGGQNMAEYLQTLAARDADETPSSGMDALIHEAAHRPVPQSLDEIYPRPAPPPGKTAMQMVRGQWPGDETEEELLALLKEMS